MWILISTFFLACIAYWLYRTYKKWESKIPLIKSLMKIYLIINLKKLLSKVEGNPVGPSSNTIVFNDNHVHITYHFNGSPHSLRIPHHPKNKLKMHQMFLIKGSTVIDITHKHGIPYYLSPKDLGGDKIIHKKGDDIIREFIDDELPYI